MKEPAQPPKETGKSDRPVSSRGETSPLQPPAAPAPPGAQPAPAAPPPAPARPAASPPRPPAAPRSVPAPAKSKPGLASPGTQSRALAETVVSSFLDRLTAEAHRKGGFLTVRDIEALNREFAKKTAALQAVFQKSFEEYVRARERSAWDQSRQYPFDRLIVRKFAHLFPEEGGAKPNLGALSRRMLPGFFVALTKMLGEEIIEHYQERCRHVVDRLKAANRGELDWYHAYADAEANAIVLEALVVIASHFTALERRAEWFINLVNDNLGPADVKREGEAAADWQLSFQPFMGFLDALFADARRALAGDAGRAAIAVAHGAEAGAILADVLTKIGQAKARG